MWFPVEVKDLFLFHMVICWLMFSQLEAFLFVHGVDTWNRSAGELTMKKRQEENLYVEDQNTSLEELVEAGINGHVGIHAIVFSKCLKDFSPEARGSMFEDELRFGWHDEPRSAFHFTF